MQYEAAKSGVSGLVPSATMPVSQIPQKCMPPGLADHNHIAQATLKDSGTLCKRTNHWLGAPSRWMRGKTPFSMQSISCEDK